MPVKHPLWHLILYISKSCKFLIETMPGGAALFDYNNDGLLDIFLVNGGKITDTLKVPEQFDRSNPRYWNVLYHNNGDGTFMDVTQKAGVSAGGWSVSAGFFDFDNDGHLDLFVTRYMEWDAKHSKTCGGAWQTYCPPGEFPATTNLLYRNCGDGTFEDISQKSGIAAKKGRALGVAFADYDGDGFTDIFVANDGMQQFLFRNNGEGSFSNRSLESGLGALTAGSSGWGVGLEDLDNDGWKDLLVAQSHVLDNVEAIDHSLHYLEPPLLALNHNGRFERAE